jgi:hypothetical protein
MSFEMNGKIYKTDNETLAVLRSIVGAAKDSGDSSAVVAVMYLGLRTGRIVDISAETATTGASA